VTESLVTVATLLALVEGATFATALRRSGKPARLRLPDDFEARTALILAHLRGGPATLTFHAEGHHSWREDVDAVALAAYCPTDDGRCPWLAIDLDGADHGGGGLIDPSRATRAIAERAGEAGLASGLLVARSRGGLGRHVFLILPGPIPLPETVIGIAALAAAAFKVAASDVAVAGPLHAFQCVGGAIARLGDPGAVELLPRSTMKPHYGWALALPAAGAFSRQGGGVIVDPFSDQPVQLDVVPGCDPMAWSRFVLEAKASLLRFGLRRSTNRGRYRPPGTGFHHFSLDRVDSRTREFLEGRVSQGARNDFAFAAAASLLGCGVDRQEVENLILHGAERCGLSSREALSCVRSALRTRRRGSNP